jgi:hypothetical protein
MWQCIDDVLTWCADACLELPVPLLWCWRSPGSSAIIGQGLALAIAAAVCNGSFAAFAKTDRVRRAQVITAHSSLSQGYQSNNSTCATARPPRASPCLATCPAAGPQSYLQRMDLRGRPLSCCSSWLCVTAAGEAALPCYGWQTLDHKLPEFIAKQPPRS